MASLFSLLVTDETLEVVGDPIVSWKSIDVTLRRNEPDSGLFTVPGYPWVVEQLYSGHRVVVIEHRDDTPDVGRIITAGPIEEWMHEESDDGENAGDGMITVNFTSDLALIAGRCAYPNPAKLADNQDVDTWTYTGNSEQAARTLVNVNAGPGAMQARKIPRLILGATAGIGSNVTVKTTRMQPVTEVLRNISAAGGDFTFRTRQSGKDILFEILQPPDVSAQVRFGFSLGNMKYRAYSVKGPTATTAIVGGQGTGASRNLIERTNATDEKNWWRIEKLVSRDGSQPLTELEDEATRALAEGAYTQRLPSNVADIPGSRYGIDYVIGSKVAIEARPGVWLTDVVSTVHLQAWPTAGSIYSATVGSQAAQSDPAWVRKLREIDEKLGRLERTVTPAP